MGRALTRRALRAIFSRMKLKGLKAKPKALVTVEDLTKFYKPLKKRSMPKFKKPAIAPAKSTGKKLSAVHRPKGVRRKKVSSAPLKQEITIKVETPKPPPKKPKRRKPKAQNPKQEAPKMEGAAKDAEKKTRRERFVEGSETVAAGETYATAASGLFGFIKKRRKGLKKLGLAGAEGAVAGGAGTAVYKFSGEEEKKKRKRRKKSSS